MGNKLEKQEGTSNRFHRFERPSNEQQMPRARSFASRTKPSEGQPSSFQELMSQKSRNSITQSTQDRFSSVPKKQIFPTEEFSPLGHRQERNRRKPERLELRELEQAVAFSRHFTETFLQCSLNPPGDFSALFPLHVNLRNQAEIPQRFRNLEVATRLKNDSESEDFHPNRDEFLVLSEMFKVESKSAHQEKSPDRHPLFPSKSLLFSHTRIEPQTEKKLRGFESRVKPKDKISKVSSSFLIDEGDSNALQSPPNKSMLNLKHKLQQQPVHFSPSKSQSQSGKKNSDDSSHQYSNEKPNRVGNNHIGQKSSSTFKINEGHVFSFQKEFALSNHLSARINATPTQIIVEDANDDHEDEPSNYMDKMGGFKGTFANQQKLPLLSTSESKAPVNRFGIRDDQSFSDSMEKDDIASPENEVEETFHRPVQRQSKKQTDFDNYESHLQTINFQAQAKLNVTDLLKGNKGGFNMRPEKPKEIIVDLQPFTKKFEKEASNPLIVNSTQQKGGVLNTRFKSPQSSLQSLNDKKNELPSGFGLKPSGSEQKPIANSIKNMMNRKDNHHPLESLVKDTKFQNGPSIIGLSNSGTQPKILSRNTATSTNHSDQNTKTYTNLFMTKKGDSKSNLMSAPSQQPSLNMLTKKEKIKETVQQTVQRIRDDAGHKKDFSGFSQVKQAEHMQDLESESVELKIYETILGDLHKPDYEQPRFESSKKGHRMSHGSRESSKHNIKVDIGNLASQVKFNLDNCFRKN